VEQPFLGPVAELVDVAQRCRLPLMADESVILIEDALQCLWPAKKVWLNIRLSKNGGFGPCRELAVAAFEADTPFAVGCMVGESSILSAAQRALLSNIPRPRFVEGNFGTFLLADDLTAKSLRFRIGGRLKYLGQGGYGVDPDPRRLARYGERLKTLRA
jgi:L-alanine-DL-glutamate epimerase-like enolase superfamily enzyme